MDKIKVVTIGGGSGHYVALSALRDIANIDITAVVSMTDSGGSTGRLRDEYGVLPPGDILKCMIALAGERDFARRMFQKRFEGIERFDGHSAGNLILTFFANHANCFPDAAEAFAQMCDVRGKVLPVTIDRATLVAVLDDGSRIFGESAIDRPNRGLIRGRIVDVFLAPHHNDLPRVYPPVLMAIQEADYIILGPGDLYTSIMPNLKVDGVASALKSAKAKIVYVANIMTKFGETDQYKLIDFIESVERVIERPVDLIIINDRKPSEDFLSRYAQEKAEFVWPILPPRAEHCIIKRDLLDDQGEVLRHSDEKLAELFMGIFQAPE